jgi:hypothetical protein
MATDTVEGLSPHVRGVTVTTVSTVAGVLAGVAANMLAGGPGDLMGLYVLGAAVLMQFPLLGQLGVDVGDFSTKDQLYIVFMTFSLWFVTWGILLTASSF